jgi:hypothetical protein
MRTPGFTGEASVYKTNNLYRLAAGGSFPTDGSTKVVPQECRLFEEVVCGGFIAEGVVLCGGLCAAGPEACLACWAGVLGGAYDLCKDCIPAGGGGGGGPAPCCPVGTTCRCGGKCVPGQGCVDGVCLRPNQECP